jgi:hypothetical protein
MSAFHPKLTLGRLAATSNAGAPRFLDWRARHVAIGTENAAVALQRFQHRAATRAIVEILARVGGHVFRGAGAALRTGDGALKFRHTGQCGHFTWRFSERPSPMSAFHPKLTLGI